MKKIVFIMAFSIFSFCCQSQWSNSGDNVTTGSLAIGSTATNSYSMLSINGPNWPTGTASKRDINFNFAAAGSSTIRSYRGSSWDTYLQFLTTGSDNSKDVRLHIDGAGNIGVGTVAPLANLHTSGMGGRVNARFTQTSTSNDSSSPVVVIEQTSPTNSSGLQINFTGSGGDQYNHSNTAALQITNSSNHRALVVNNSSGKRLFEVNKDGNVGIGTIHPQFSLDVRGGNGYIGSNGLMFHASGNAPDGLPYARFTENYGIRFSSPDPRWVFSSKPSVLIGYAPNGQNWGNDNLFVAGNVGIGTTNPDALLAVKGDIHAQEVRVDLNVPGPDYVFEPSYDLKPLAEIESYIKENKHLPEVPSAKEMEKNGVQLGEMNMLLLKKVEELTLHLIKQQSMIEAQNKEIEKLKTQIK
jgi:hypothetical protein